ncbi:hypothetical protein LEP1GSC008_1737 [Leptospira kirschneri serovar Bulgarica str. Nikolaevo]|uniref:Uncharacterized protein n=1 Tax=Leptospira kirschneri serovar Bulgarica str. Nikolaevo TaxID=1240687 RepID=M6FBJ5_9LEPT|nr:hypothetical protein LEP1GSC008_1737 [Leptospira kirschneri serovar Bulgarica str. Nikolaevo]
MSKKVVFKNRILLSNLATMSVVCKLSALPLVIEIKTLYVAVVT